MKNDDTTKKSTSISSSSSSSTTQKVLTEKRHKLKDDMKKIERTVKKLQGNLNESAETDHKLLTNIRMDRLKNQGLANELEEAKKENKHLLNILQQRSGEIENRTSSVDIPSSSCSTMSLVNLQYKYEELVASHNGLLKVLEMRITEIQKAHSDNNSLRMELETLKDHISKYSARTRRLQDKILDLRERKDDKILALRRERDTLKIVHAQLVELLKKQCTEKDEQLAGEIKNSKFSDKASLLREVRKNNLLNFENFKLSQENQYLRTALNYTAREKQSKSSKSSISNV